MAMAAYAARRTFFYVVVFFVVSFLLFFYLHANIDSFTWANGGDIFRPLSIEDENVVFRHIFPLYEPITLQYFHWINDFFSGQWGTPWVLGIQP